MEALKQIIEESFGLRPEHFPPEVQNSVDEVIKLLQQGKLRVAEKIDGNWVTHEWIKKAVLLSFQLYPNKMVRAGDLSFFDKVPSRFDHFSESDWKESGIRCVPTAVARHGSYIAPSVVLMTPDIIPCTKISAVCITVNTNMIREAFASFSWVFRISK